MASNPHHKNGYKKPQNCTQNLPICFQYVEKEEEYKLKFGRAPSKLKKTIKPKPNRKEKQFSCSNDGSKTINYSFYMFNN